MVFNCKKFYERIISEFYCKWGTLLTQDKYQIDDIDFNKIITKYINDRNEGKDEQNGKYGHYMEQYKYLDKFNIHVLKFENIYKILII